MIKGKNKNKKIKFDAEAGVFVQTEEIIIGAKSNDARVLKNNLKLELVQIVEQVKTLKVRADEVKEMLKLLDEQKEEDEAIKKEMPPKEINGKNKVVC